MNGFNWDEETGHFLSAEHQRIAQVIHDYDETLELAWIPPKDRALNEKYPFAVIHRPDNAPPYIVMRLQETEVDHRVVARLWNADNSNHNVLSAIEADEAARRALEMLRREEENLEAREKAAWAIKAPSGATMDGIKLL